MNATNQLAKYERLAETAHRMGAYKCARKWSLKAEKLEAVISALREVEMSNYQKLVNCFCEAGNSEEIAKKAASVILNAARSYQAFEEIKSKFNPKHHDFIKEIMADEQVKERELEKKADDLADAYEAKVNEQWESLDAYVSAPLNGSPKQIAWAQSIRGYAIERELAPAVANGEISFQEAVKTISNPDSKYWIENRKQWGMR
ncbi:hypothetical protein [Floridanema evergladense]|uniref:Uncharacterized protein n=1 Tax=Floridaenema evergladense BLCC-F167 TaxID=3153639 RepID=A0ABV4WCX6_9CYAN